MMVNELKNNSVPWQSTVPSQMPWMSSYNSITDSLPQFGHDLSGVGVYSDLQDPIHVQHHPQHAPHSSSLSASNLFGTPLGPTFSGLPMQEAPNLNPLTSPSHAPQILQHPLNATNPVPSNSQNPTFVSSSSSQNSNNSSPLTYMPGFRPEPQSPRSQKRASVDMEDDQMDPRPTKQLLSEKKLFKQFSSLHLNGANLVSSNPSSSESDDSDEETRSRTAGHLCTQDQSREEFNRYVYLLFKDRNQNNRPFETSNSTLDRLAREERDKLSKAVVLWAPPLNPNPFGQNNDDCNSSDEEFTYKDHRDFLKQTADSSCTIEEVVESTVTVAHDEMMLD